MYPGLRTRIEYPTSSIDIGVGFGFRTESIVQKGESGEGGRLLQKVDISVDTSIHAYEGVANLFQQYTDQVHNSLDAYLSVLTRTFFFAHSTARLAASCFTAGNEKKRERWKSVGRRVLWIVE
jgi:hypothetical protein